MSHVDLIRISFLTTILLCASKKNLFARKIYERSTSPTRPNCRYGPGISFPGWSCLTFLVTFVFNRRRDPDILSASSLTCRYRYIGSTPATVDRETKSILYPDCVRDSRVYIFSRLAVIPLVWNVQSFRRDEMNETLCWTFCFAKSFSIISEKLCAASSPSLYFVKINELK